MTNERDLQILRQGILDMREEMVALKGIIRALLKHSSLTNEEIRSAVQEAARDPVGPDPGRVLSLAIPLIDASEDPRAKNRGE